MGWGVLVYTQQLTACDPALVVITPFCSVLRNFWFSTAVLLGLVFQSAFFAQSEIL